jgi:ribonuclease P protein component
MASVRAWPRQEAAGCWPRAAQRAASAFLPELFRLPQGRAAPNRRARTRSMTADLATLKTRADFLRVAAGRRRAVRPAFIVQAAPQPVPEVGSKSIRVGFTASRKVGNAVVRNRAKRRLRALAAEVLPQIGRLGTDYVLVARSTARERPYADLLADLETALRQIDRQRASGRSSHRVRAAREE